MRGRGFGLALVLTLGAVVAAGCSGRAAEIAAPRPTIQRLIPDIPDERATATPTTTATATPTEPPTSTPTATRTPSPVPTPIATATRTAVPTPTAVRTAPQPTPTRVPAATPARASCSPAYPDFCIPPSPPDLDCPDIGRKRFTVLAPDPHRFDADSDGIGCES